ncbi:MAG: S-layer homology domain-containing protein [Oscillospiraceae bacterium]|jgi:uncharacterized protein YkwD|nr:S-layer homology domain-containing protein [Oscillospiraceae bacterium]
MRHTIKRTLKHTLTLALSLIVLLTLTPSTRAVTGGYFRPLAETGQTFTERRADIIAARRAIPSAPDAPYDITPKVSAPYDEGTLKSETLEAALAQLNYYRLLAGLPAVELDDDYVAAAQTGALLVALSSATGQLAHTPERREDMTDDLYARGIAGIANPIEYGYRNLSDALTLGWLAGDSESQLATVGDRRQLLNPALGATGFGQVGRGYVAFADDDTGDYVDYEYVAYPAGAAFSTQDFPASNPWSVSLNPLIFAAPTAEDITVTLEGAGRVYEFNTTNSAASGNYLRVDINDDNAYGIPNAIIFRPANVASYTGLYKVTISGVRLLDGTALTLSYSTRFFDVDASGDGASGWAKPELELAEAEGLVTPEFRTGFTAAVTRAEFCVAVINFLETYYGQPAGEIIAIRAATNSLAAPNAWFTDTSDPRIIQAAQLGIIKGTNEEKKLFDPNGKLKRQEAATMLYRLASDVIGLQISHAAVNWTDGDQIQAYAKESVDAMFGIDVIRGMETTRLVFSPLGTYTREQSALTFLRLFEII